MANPMNVARILVDHATRNWGGEVGIIALYGSRAKGTATRTSDLDLYFVPDDAKTRRALSMTFVLDGLPYDFWGPGWPFLEAIADAAAPQRPWAVSASLIADAQVIWHRSQEDADRFAGLQARIAELCRPESRSIMVEKALAEYRTTLFQLEQMRRAIAAGDQAGSRWAGWKLMGSAVNCLALVNQVFFHKGWGSNHSEILALEERPPELDRRLAAILQPVSGESALEAAADLSAEVREILLTAQASLASSAPATTIFAGFYFFVWEYRNKILKACERQDAIEAASAAFHLQEELCLMLNKTDKGFYGTDFNLLGEYEHAYVNAGFPDLLGPASAGDLPELSMRTVALDEAIRTWFESEEIDLGLLEDEADLRQHLDRS